MPQKTSAIFVVGSDEAGVKDKAIELVSEMVPDADAFGLETVDGAVDSVDAAANRIGDAVNALQTLPFLGGEKFVWFKNVTFLSDTVTGRSETVGSAMDVLCKTLEAGLAEGITFLMSATGVHKGRTHYKRLVKCSRVVAVDLPDMGFGNNEERIIAWVREQAHDRQVCLGRGAADMLAARVGAIPKQLATEFDKLLSAYPGEEITAEAIRLLVPQTREGGIFDLSGAILQRDLPLALETLEQLFYQGEKAVGIMLAAIIPTVRNLLLMKDLVVRLRLQPNAYTGQFLTNLNSLPAQEIAHLPRKKDGSGINAYPLALASVHTKNFTLPGLHHAYAACAQAAEDLFKTGSSDNAVLSRLLIEILST